MSTRLLLSVIALLLAVAAGIGAVLIGQSVNKAGAGGTALIGGPFTLVNQHGERVTEKDFEGRFMLAYFGYTFCPDFCPLGLGTITEALEMLDEKEAGQITPVFFTVDPARDTVETMGPALAKWSPHLVGLTGSEAALADARAAFQVEASQVGEDFEGRPIYAHGSFVYLIGPDGKVLTLLPPILGPERMAEIIGSYL